MQSAAGIQLAIALLISCHDSMQAYMQTFVQCSCMSYGCGCLQDSIQSEGAGAASIVAVKPPFKHLTNHAHQCVPAQNTYHLLRSEAGTHKSKTVDTSADT